MKEKININDEVIELDINDLLLHTFYSSMWIIKARYKMYNGAKDTMKSKSAALRVATKFLAGKYRNIVVLRKFANYNTTSTFTDVRWAFNLIADVYNIPQLIPISKDEYNKGKSARLTFTKTSPHVIEDTVTKTVIFFTGLDRLRSGGITLTDNPKHAVDTIWYEEPVEVDLDSGEVMDDTSFVKWQVAESTILRGYRDEDEDGNQIIKKGFEWIEEEIIFTYNSHDEEHWLLKDFADRYVPINKNDEEDMDRMEREKFRVFYDPKFQGGDGLFITRTTMFLNPGRDRNWMERMRKETPELFSYLVLSATRPIGGAAYAGLMPLVDTTPTDYKTLWPLGIGIDYAISSEHGDWFTAVFLGTNTSRSGKPLFDQKVYFDEWGWNNKLMKTKYDEQLAEDVLNKLIKKIESYPELGRKIQAAGFTITVDWQATHFITVMANTIMQSLLKHPEHKKWLSRIKVIAVEGKNAKIMLEETGRGVYAKLGRVLNNRRFMEAGMYKIDKAACPNFYRQVGQTALIRTKAGDTIVVDKNNDWIDGGDYAYMTKRWNAMFNRALNDKRSNHVSELLD